MSERPGTRVKYEPPDPRRVYTIMTEEDKEKGKKSNWHELEITGSVRNVSPELWKLHFLTSLFLNNNCLSRLPAEVSQLKCLVHLDLSCNKLRSLPAELGDMIQLRELLLNNNSLRALPYELGRLFLLQTLGLSGNPLSPELINMVKEPNGTSRLLTFMLDNLQVCPRPPDRPWVQIRPIDRQRCGTTFTVMCYNVLCEKYATRQLYGYCPSWALLWDYRKQNIMKELLNYSADVISLQEVATDQFYSFFKPELHRHGYDGVFSPKSRAKTMSEPESMQVDGCAIFYRTSKFLFVDQYLVEFNQMAMAYSEGADDMLNRVMPKDNIAILALLEVKEVGVLHQDQRQHIMVSNSHIHWDPELRDVKLIQSMLLVNEIHQIMKQVATERGIGMQTSSTGEMLPKGLNIPLIMCCDLNSLPDSGVVEYLTTGRVASDHPDFQSLKYHGFLQRFMDKKVSPTSSGNVSHPFNLSSVYLGNELPFTNFTYDFTGIIDYIMYTKDLLSPLGLLGKISEEWLTQNKIIAYPHPHFSSDHIPLLTEVEIVADQRR